MRGGGGLRPEKNTCGHVCRHQKPPQKKFKALPSSSNLAPPTAKRRISRPRAIHKVLWDGISREGRPVPICPRETNGRLYVGRSPRTGRSTPAESGALRRYSQFGHVGGTFVSPICRFFRRRGTYCGHPAPFWRAGDISRQAGYVSFPQALKRDCADGLISRRWFRTNPGHTRPPKGPSNPFPYQAFEKKSALAGCCREKPFPLTGAVRQQKGRIHCARALEPKKKPIRLARSGFGNIWGGAVCGAQPLPEGGDPIFKEAARGVTAPKKLSRHGHVSGNTNSSQGGWGFSLPCAGREARRNRVPGFNKVVAERGAPEIFPAARPSGGKVQ